MIHFAFRLETLIKVVKSAGNLVRSHLAPLVSSMLEATQAAEGQSLNYLSVRLGTQLATQEKLDVARISAAKSSSLFETVQHVWIQNIVHYLKLFSLNYVIFFNSAFSLLTRGTQVKLCRL